METLESRDLPGVLGTSTLLEGPSAGSDSVILTTTDTWTATSNASWLHTNASGTGNSVVTLAFDANAGATRTGTLTIDGLTLTVTQAGSNYSAANPITTLGSGGSGNSFGVAVDSSGNVYFANISTIETVQEYVAATGTVTPLVSAGLNGPVGVRVDSSGNVYIADQGNNAVYEYVAATGTVKTLVSTGLNNPSDVAVDSSGNVYIADFSNGAVEEYVASTGTVKTLVSTGLSGPSGVAVDSSGNVYIADYGNNAVYEYVATTGTVKTLVSTGLSGPQFMAVDSSGNVYFSDSNNNAIKEYVAATGVVTTLVSGLAQPEGVAVDSSGNVYFSDYLEVNELVRAYVPTSPVTLPNAAGASQLTVVLPSTQSLTGLFAPTSDQSWLTITGTNNGIVSYSYTNNTGATSRTAHITVLGQSITVTQAGPTLVDPTVVEGPTAEGDAVQLLAFNAWTATSNTSWLHTTASGTGNGLVTFTFDANTGATRLGTLTVDGVTLTVVQAGSNYSPANPVTLPISGLNIPTGVAVDSSGNIYFANFLSNTVKEYVAATGTVTTLVSTGLSSPVGVAVDSSGNVYIADEGNNAVKEYNAATGQVTTLVSTGLNHPEAVAVDSAGNVYIGDTSNNNPNTPNTATGTVTTLPISGLIGPDGVAVDSSGNVYFNSSNPGDNSLLEYNPSTGMVTTLFFTGSNGLNGVAVDSLGNVYATEYAAGVVKEYVAATQAVITLPNSGLFTPGGVAVDSSGNVYIADELNNAIKELVRAYVPISPVTLTAAAGSGEFAVLATESLTGLVATSDQNWLTIAGTSNGMVVYSCTANTGTTSRTAHITVLGQTITFTQAAPFVPSVVSGVVFLDTNGNGVLDSDETGLAGQTVFVDLNGTGILAVGDPSTVTDANGNYTLDLLGLPAGNYRVEVALTGVEQATGSPLIVTTPGFPQASGNLGVRPTSSVVPVAASPDLFNSPVPANPNAAYVQSIYQAVLGRDPSASELENNSLANLQSAATEADREAAASEFLNSPEYLKDEVDSFYETYLGRQADSAGEANYISLLQQGMDPRQVVVLFVTSAEYTNEHADASDFVQSLFQKVLGRTGSDGEISSYVQLMANGMSRAAVARGILYSAENDQLTVQAFYSQFLQRSADATGLAIYVAQLENGANLSTVAAEILASTEFFNRASNG